MPTAIAGARKYNSRSRAHQHAHGEGPHRIGALGVAESSRVSTPQTMAEGRLRRTGFCQRFITNAI